MSIKSLLNMCFDTILRLTLKCSLEISKTEELWTIVFEIWSYIVLISPNTTELYYKLLNKYLHWLSHDCKTPYDELGHFRTLTADDVFNVLITCQSPKLIFDYKMKRQRMTSENLLPLVDNSKLIHYFKNSLTELDISGVDFCCNDELLVKLLPKCRSLLVLCLGNAGSDQVLKAATSCPLRKLQLEERFPLQPKLPQDTVLKYLLGHNGTTEHLNFLLEICKLKSQALIEIPSEENEASEESDPERIKCLHMFLDNCKPSWPNLEILIFGNCRICREALIICLLVLRSLEEISIHRIQSDEILNTCERMFSSFELDYRVSIKRLILWAGWSGFGSNVLRLAPDVNNLGLISYGYSQFSLRETVEKNKTLDKVDSLSLVGLRHAGESIFRSANQFLNGIKNLDISGVILSTEELVNIFGCLPHLFKLQLDYSELRNHNYVCAGRNIPKNMPLKHFFAETSYIDIEFLQALFIMANTIKRLSIRGKTRSFSLSFAHQRIFLHSPDLTIHYLELYPQYPLDILGLVALTKNRKVKEGRLELNVPLTSLTSRDMTVLIINGWHIVPACSRC